MEKIAMLKLSGDCIYINAEHRRRILDKWVFLCVGNEAKCYDINRKILRGETDTSQYPKNIQSFDDILYWVDFWKSKKG